MAHGCAGVVVTALSAGLLVDAAAHHPAMWLMTALAVLAGMVAYPFDRQLLADAGCALIQGWIAAHPMPGAELVRWLSAADLAVDRQRQA